MCIILCLLGLTGVGVVTILEGEEDQLAGVLGEPDAVGVLVESLLAGVLVAVHLGLGTVQGPGVWILLLYGHGGLLGEVSPQVFIGAVHLDTVEQGSRGMLRCRSGMASRIGRRSTGHRENVLVTAFSEVTFFLVLSLAELFLTTFLSVLSLAAASSSLACSLAFSLTAFSALCSA